MATKSVLITGAGGGLGRALLELLVSHEWRVFATDYCEEALDHVRHDPDVIPLVMDVTDQASVESAFAQVSAKTDRLDGIVNFAGILAVVSMVDMPEEQLQRVLDVNLMGTYRTNKAFFPLVHAAKGRIVNISSETGWQSAAPFNGAYAMSKHAIEAYSDSLRRELALLGVKVIKVQPGAFKTSMLHSIEKKFNEAEQSSTYFPRVLRRLKALAAKTTDKGHDPDELAEVIYRALSSKAPKASYSVKPDPSRSVLEWLPRRVADAIWLAVLGKAKHS